MSPTSFYITVIALLLATWFGIWLIRHGIKHKKTADESNTAETEGNWIKRAGILVLFLVVMAILSLFGGSYLPNPMGQSANIPSYSMPEPTPDPLVLEEAPNLAEQRLKDEKAEARKYLKEFEGD